MDNDNIICEFYDQPLTAVERYAAYKIELEFLKSPVRREQIAQLIKAQYPHDYKDYFYNLLKMHKTYDELHIWLLDQLGIFATIKNTVFTLKSNLAMIRGDMMEDETPPVITTGPKMFDETLDSFRKTYTTITK